MMPPPNRGPSPRYAVGALERVLPLGLAIPGAVPVVPAVILAQTLVELLCELLYVRLLPRLGAASS